MMKISSNGKVRRSEEEWQEIFSRFRESGMTEAAFCREENIAKSPKRGDYATSEA